MLVYAFIFLQCGILFLNRYERKSECFQRDGGFRRRKVQCDEIRSGIESIKENRFDRSHEDINRGVVWWKMPMEFLRYYLLRVSPVQTVSMAAAMIEFLIFSHRLHEMKNTRALQIKFMDDKVSLFRCYFCWIFIVFFINLAQIQSLIVVDVMPLIRKIVFMKKASKITI